MIARVVLLAIAASVAIPVTLPAQAPDSIRPPIDRRAQIEQQLRQRLGQVVRTRLGLSEDQARRLFETDRRLAPVRQQLAMRERRARQELRQALMAGATDGATDQRAVGALLDQMIQIQRDRVELIAREQRELAEFLTPVQRARYMALQADLRRRVEMMQRQREGRMMRRPGAQRPRFR